MYMSPTNHRDRFGTEKLKYKSNPMNQTMNSNYTDNRINNDRRIEFKENDSIDFKEKNFINKNKVTATLFKNNFNSSRFFQEKKTNRVTSPVWK